MVTEWLDLRRNEEMKAAIRDICQRLQRTVYLTWRAPLHGCVNDFLTHYLLYTQVKDHVFQTTAAGYPKDTIAAPYIYKNITCTRESGLSLHVLWTNLGWRRCHLDGTVLFSPSVTAPRHSTVMNNLTLRSFRRPRVPMYSA